MGVYYNEIDPYAAEWLRNLIEAGELPDGVVDERSIVDVQGGDLEGFSEVHFFAGIGGWPRAFRLADYRGPVWTGSPPCQPLSSAGQRKGHADERHLWPAFHRLVAERRPAVLFGEQVASKDGREWFSAVRADLEELGYACGCACLPAAGVGAPHLRYRLFFVADAAYGDDGGGQARRRGNGSTHDGAYGRPNPPDSFWRDADWLFCRDGKWRPVPTIESEIFPLASGISNRVGLLRGAGNSIVPQVAAEFIRAYLECR